MGFGRLFESFRGYRRDWLVGDPELTAKVVRPSSR
jgi:hypothetical protein